LGTVLGEAAPEIVARAQAKGIPITGLEAAD